MQYAVNDSSTHKRPNLQLMLKSEFPDLMYNEPGTMLHCCKGALWCCGWSGTEAGMGAIIVFLIPV